MRALRGAISAFLTVTVFLLPVIGQNSVIQLKPSVSKTTFKLPSLPRKDVQVSATYTIVAPEDRRVLLRCENDGHVSKVTFSYNVIG